MQWLGIVIGAVSFLSIGIFHPIVIKSEYYFGKECWPCFAILGAGFLIGSLFSGSVFLSSVLAVIGMSCLWSILELFEQEQRVAKGWFPANPKRAEKKKHGTPSSITAVGTQNSRKENEESADG